MLAVNILDNEPLSRLGISCLVEEAFPGSLMEFSGNIQSFLKRNRKTRYDLLIIRVQELDNENILSITNTVSLCKGLKVLALCDRPPAIYPQILAGMPMVGYARYGSTIKQIKKAIGQLMATRVYTSPPENAVDADFFQRLVNSKANPFLLLTKRENEIVGLMLKGEKPSGISKKLGLQPSTISTFKTRIYEKLGISNIVELVKMAGFYNQHEREDILYSSN